MDAKKEEPSLQDVAKFLLGEGELNGCSFGEKPENERGNYWWRTYLRSALAQPAQGEVVAWQMFYPSGGFCMTTDHLATAENFMRSGYRVVPVASLDALSADTANLVTVDKRDLFDFVRVAIMDAMQHDERTNDDASDWSEATDRALKCLGKLYSGAQPPADTIAVPRSEWETMKRDAESYRILTEVYENDEIDSAYWDGADTLFSTIARIQSERAKSTGEDV